VLCNWIRNYSTALAVELSMPFSRWSFQAAGLHQAGGLDAPVLRIHPPHPGLRPGLKNAEYKAGRSPDEGEEDHEEGRVASCG
jgi:hypothetical protein